MTVSKCSEPVFIGSLFFYVQTCLSVSVKDTEGEGVAEGEGGSVQTLADRLFREVEYAIPTGWSNSMVLQDHPKQDVFWAVPSGEFQKTLVGGIPVAACKFVPALFVSVDLSVRQNLVLAAGDD